MFYDETLPIEKIIAIIIVIVGLFISQIQFKTKKARRENTIV